MKIYVKIPCPPSVHKKSCIFNFSLLLTSNKRKSYLSSKVVSLWVQWNVVSDLSSLCQVQNKNCMQCLTLNLTVWVLFWQKIWVLLKRNLLKNRFMTMENWCKFVAKMKRKVKTVTLIFLLLLSAIVSAKEREVKARWRNLD